MGLLLPGCIYIVKNQNRVNSVSHLDILQNIQIKQPIPSHYGLKYNSWVEIDAHAIEYNIASYKNIIKPALLAPVIKSNAYGHGIGLIASLCQTNDNVDMLCVVSVAEALYLRSIGITKHILVLSILRDDLEQAIVQDIQLVVCDMNFAHLLNQMGRQIKKKVEVHIKIDTGLSRLGFLAQTAFEHIKQIAKLPFISIKGIFTHFAESESEDQTFTHMQIAQFEHLIETLECEHISIPLRHTSCSAAITANIKSHFNMARFGIGLYGLWASQENKTLTSTLYPSFNLKPALTWKTTIMHIKEIPAHAYVGYDRTFQTKKASLIATLPIGYWDGFDRRFSNAGIVMINNQHAPVVGKIAMNLTMIDVSEIAAHVGDEVILLGNYSQLSANDLAKRCSTINYEIVTRINPLLPRVVV